MITIIKYTSKEMLKKRAFLLIAILTLGYLVIYSYGLNLAFHSYNSTGQPDIGKVILESQLLSAGLYFGNFIVAFLVVLTSVSSISGDIESGVIYAVLAKPIRRYEIVLGRFIGLGIFVTVYSTVLFLSIVGLNIAFGTNINLETTNIFKALFFFDLGPITLLSLVIASSSVLSTVNTGILAVMTYGISMIGGMMEQMGAFFPKGNEGLINTGIITSLILPTDVIFRKMNSVLLTQDSSLSLLTQGPFGGVSQPSPYMFMYIFIYIIFLIYYGSRKFTLRDL